MIGQIVEERYLIEEELGEGAMGCVYRARHVKVGRQVAIKVMHRELAKVPTIVERFAREAMIAARLRHPNLVCVLDVGTTPDGLPMIVLELAPGDALTEVVTGPLARERVMNLMSQLLKGLEHAHDAGLVHRDLKPDNILVETTSEGREIPRIVDFGIAITAERDDSTIGGRRLTEANMVIGTPFYMSPEQSRAKDVDHRTDLFSLGVICYELLAGMPPFPGTSVDCALANASMDPPAIADRAGIEVDPLLEAFARKLMARKLSHRFQTAREAIMVLELIQRDRISAARALSETSLALSTIVVPSIVVPRLAPHSDLMTTHQVTKVTRVEPMTRASRVGRRVGAAAACALAALTIATGWSMRDGREVAFEAPSVEATGSSAEPDSSGRTVVAQVTPIAHEMPTLHATTAAVAAPHIAKVATRIAPPAAPRAVERPAVAAPAPAKVDGDANAVIAKYVAIGRALKHCPSADELWRSYRLIRINDAIATEDSRRAALSALQRIEQRIPARS